MIRRSLLPLAALLLLAGCGGSSSSNGGLPTIQAAKQYTLAKFTPSSPVTAGKPVRVSFVVRQPDGKPLTKYKHGAGPHTGVHLIIVRRDLATMIHTHPPIAPDGTATATVTFPEPGPYRVVVDVYPQTTGPQANFQLFTTLRVAGSYTPKPLPPFSPTDVIDGYRVTMQGTPNLHAVADDYLHITVTSPDGKPAAQARRGSAGRARHRDTSRWASWSRCRASGGSSCSSRSTARCSRHRSRWT